VTGLINFLWGLPVTGVVVSGFLLIIFMIILISYIVDTLVGMWRERKKS
jgi:hypothetical protein